MARIVLGGFTAFVVWLVLWFGIDIVLSAVWPAYGEHQRMYGEAFRSGGRFAANTLMLMVQLFVGAVLTLSTARLSAWISGEKQFAPAVLGALLIAMAAIRVTLTLGTMPLWYHILFAGMMLPLALRGGGHRPDSATPLPETLFRRK